MGRAKKSEIIVEREKIIEHLEKKPLTKSDMKEIVKESKPKREMSEKQKAHIANLVQKNRERFQKVAEDNKQKKEQIKQEKEEIIKKKVNFTKTTGSEKEKKGPWRTNKVGDKIKHPDTGEDMKWCPNHGKTGCYMPA